MLYARHCTHIDLAHFFPIICSQSNYKFYYHDHQIIFPCSVCFCYQYCHTACRSCLFSLISCIRITRSSFNFAPPPLVVGCLACSPATSPLLSPRKKWLGNRPWNGGRWARAPLMCPSLDIMLVFFSYSRTLHCQGTSNESWTKYLLALMVMCPGASDGHSNHSFKFFHVGPLALAAIYT